jgi:hypothetical protein
MQMEGDAVAPRTETQKYVRFETCGRAAYGRWRDDTIEELEGSIYTIRWRCFC